MKTIWKRAGALLLTLALALGLACCAGEGTQNEESAGGNLSYGLSNPWDSLMPYYSLSGSNYSRIIYDKIYDRLAYIQADGTYQGLPRAGRAATTGRPLSLLWTRRPPSTTAPPSPPSTGWRPSS